MPGISAVEFEQRLSVIRQGMAQQELDALLVYSWKRGQVRYISGYQPNYVANVAMIVISGAGEPALLIRFPFDMERARKMSWLLDVRASGDLPGLVRDCRMVLEERGAFGESGEQPIRIGLVGGDSIVDEMPHSMFTMLQAAFPEAKLAPAVDLFEQARLRKSPAEAELMRASAQVADAALAAAARTAQVGRSEYQVIAAAEATARALGAEDMLSVIAPAAWELVGPPEMRTLGDEEMLVVEFAVQVEGYYTQVPGVLHTGAPSAEQREMYQVAYRGYQAGLQAARPGHAVGDVARAELAALEEAGWLAWHAYDLGHGDGLDHPEVPSIVPTSQVPIQPGMALCIHPGLRKPGVGGVFVGGTALIGQDGATPLHHVPETLEP